MEHRRYYLVLGFRESLLESASDVTPWITENRFQEPPRLDWIVLERERPRSTGTYAMLVLDCATPVPFETATELVQSIEAMYSIWRFCSQLTLGLSPFPLPDNVRSQLTVPLSKQWLLENCLDEIYSCFGGTHDFEISFGSYCVLPPDDFRQCFPWIGRCFREERFRNAVDFLYKSMKDLGWDHCDWRDEGYDDQFNPHVSVSEAESAAQHAFKCIEAIIGEPSKTRPHKLATCLRNKGLDPDVRVGIRKKDTLFNKIVEFHDIRDSVAAHGYSKRKRRLSVPEIIEMQAVARYMLLNAQS